MRIEIYHNQNDVVARSGHLAVKKNGVILGMVKPQIRVKLQRAVLLPNFV